MMAFPVTTDKRIITLLDWMMSNDVRHLYPWTLAPFGLSVDYQGQEGKTPSIAAGEII